MTTLNSIPEPGISPDNMVTRFTADQWDIAQAGGLTMSDKNLTDALIAFDMQKYYYEKVGTPGAGQQLFNADANSGYIQFDTANILSASGTATPITQDKGYSQYFSQYLRDGSLLASGLSNAEIAIIQSLLPTLRDWYVQASAANMDATDSSNLGAFMLGGAGNDILTGGAGNDVLVDGAGNDILTGGAGNNVLMAGSGNDTFMGGQGNDTLYGGVGNNTFNYVTSGGAAIETIIDPYGNGSIEVNGTQLANVTTLLTTSQTGSTWSDSNGDQFQFVISPTDASTGTLTITQGLLGNGSNKIVIQNFDMNAAQTNANGYLGIKFEQQLALQADTSATSPFATGVPSDQSTVVANGNTKTFTVYASSASSTDQIVQLALTGGTGSYDISTGANLLSLSSPVNLVIPAGQDHATFTLVDLSNTNTPDTAQLTASLTDANGTVISNNLTVSFGDPAVGITNASPAASISAPNRNAVIPQSSGLDALYFKEYYIDGGNDLVVTGDTSSYVYATSANNTIRGGAGNDEIDSLQGNTLISGGGGQDIITTYQGNNQIYAGTQTDLATALAGRSGQASGEHGSLIAVSGGNNLVVGGKGNDAIITGTGNNTLILGAGANIVWGGLMIDPNTPFPLGKRYGYFLQSVDSPVFSSSPEGSYAPVPWSIDYSATLGFVHAGMGNIITAGNGPGTSSSYHGSTDDNGAAVGYTNDTIFGGTGNSIYALSNGNNYLDAGGGNDLIFAGIGNSTIFGGVGNDTIYGGGGNNYINTESGNDYVVAFGGNNTIIGGAGNNTIYSGDDGAGWASSEATANNYIYGGAGKSYIYGSAGNDTLLGGTGDATISGGDGNEYIVGGDGNVSINGGNGHDTIYAGGAGKDTIYAGSGNTSIYGGNGSDYIVGGAGIDLISAGDGGTTDAPTIVYAGSGTSTLYGGASVDQLVGGNGFDTLIAGTGTSTLQGGTGTEVMYSSVGNATLVAGSGNDTLYGGGGTDALVGSSGNTVFVAGSGNESIYGGSGQNTYQFNDGFGNIELSLLHGGNAFQFGPGISPTNVTVSATLGSDGSPALLIQTGNGGSLIIDNGLQGSVGQFAFADGTALTLSQLIASANTTSTTVSAGNGDLIFSANGGDSLTGGTGSDTLYGWNGNDTLTAGSGDQAIYSESGYDLVTGGAGNDTLISSGYDTLVGGTGDTTFVVQTTTDLIQAQSTGSNTNTIKSSVSYVLPANVQNLTLIGTAALTGTGNDIANVITANSGNDTLIAGTGMATLVGGAGNDTFEVNNTADVILEQPNQGNNTVLSSVNFMLPANVQNLTLTGNADLTATGNNLNNVLTANNGNDTLIGGTGNDTLIAGTGNDWLISGTGMDTLVGGSGQDTFVVHNSGDVIIEQPYSGAATVLATVNYILPDNVDVLTLTGSVNLVATGNSGNDVITGNAGNDTLIAGSGNDTLIAGSGFATLQGGVGNDTFIVNNSADVVQAQSTGTNINTVMSSASYSLANASNVQNLTLTGTADLSATGNGLNNILTANSGNDTLIAGSGNDTLIAGTGNSTLIGGTGQDTFVLGYGMGANTLIAPSAQGGVIQLQAGLQLTDLTATQQGNDLLLQIAGTSTHFLLQGYYTTPQTWTVEDASSNSATAQSIADATAQRAADPVAQLEYDFIEQSKVYDINNLKSNGYLLQPDGTWVHRGYSAPIRGTYFADVDTTTTTQSLVGAGGGIVDIITSVNNVYGLSFIPNDGQLNRSISTINLVNTTTNDAVIHADNPNVTTSYSTRSLPVAWSVAGASGNFGYIIASQNSNPIYGYVNDPLAPGGQHIGIIGLDNSTTVQTTTGTPYLGTILTTPLAMAEQLGNLTLPLFANVDYIDTYIPQEIQVINVGAGDHTVYGGGYHGAEVVVNAGSGNDVIYNNGFSYGGTGNDTLIGTGTLVAGSGNDLLINTGGNATLIGGSGNDSMFAGIQGNTTFVINAGNTGVDLIGGGGNSSAAVLNAFYDSQGIPNWEESYTNPDQYSYVQSNGKFIRVIYVNAQDASAVAAGWGLTLQQALSAGSMNYIAPLPVLAIVAGTTPPDAYYATSNTPQVTLSADDFQTLAPYYAQGIIPTNHVQLGAGIALANLSLSWGVVVGSISGLTTDPQLRYTTLNISSGATNPTLEIMIPHTDDPIGSGVTEFDFADGTKLGIAQLIAMASPAPTFDPQIFVYQPGMGVQTLGAGYTSIQFGAGITSSMITLGLGSLMLRVGTNGDVIHITQFDPTHALAPNSIQKFSFADGTSLSYDQLLTRGFDIYGTTGNETLTGTNLDNRIYAGSGNDTLIGSGANDTLTAGAGPDTLIGGKGNETFVINNVNDVIQAQSTGSNINTVLSSVSYVASANVKNLILTGTADLTATGNTLNNTLTANSGNDTLIAGLGLTTMVGGIGNDTFVVNNVNDVVQAQATGTNTNTVLSSVSYTAPVNVQNITLTGTANLTATGNTLNDVITGNTGNDTLIAGSGNDTLIAGSGNATLVGGSGVDTFVFNHGGTYTLIDPIKTVGDVIQFGPGITSSMITLGLGSLMLRVGTSGEVIHIMNFDPTHALAPNAIQKFSFADGTSLSYDQLLTRGFDIYGTTGNETLSGTNLDNRIYAGTGNDSLIGTGANDTLTAGAGVDTMIGGVGNETFVVNNTGDTIIANANAASNKVLSSVSYVAPANVPNITLTGTANLTATGNNLNNIITANSGNDTLIAGVGLATMVGGIGNDTFVVNNVNDVVQAQSTGTNTNTVLSSVSYTAPVNVQNITLTGTNNLTATGNNLNDVITGNAGNDTLIAGSGNDILIAGTGAATLIGGTGNDTFAVNNINDVVQAQSTGSNTNTVLSSVSYTAPANVQNITLTGTANLTATGNNLNNIITANSGNDTLIAGVGLATMVGGTGNDTFVVNNTADVVQAQSTGTNTNTVLSSVSYVAPANVPNITLTGTADLTATGNTLNNVITANSGNDILIAGSGLATLIGGTGNDTFVVNNAADVVQAQSTGTNTVLSSVSYTAPANVQNITLTGTADLTATGNSLNNIITANSGNDTLIAGAGLATMVGGTGNDTFVVNNVNDVIQAQATGSNTTNVLSSVSYVLPANVQNLTLTGTADLKATGNALDNVITGNAGNDTLIGGSGNDTLIAGSGLATMIGGSGNNTFVVNKANDVILVKPVEEGDDSESGKAQINTVLSSVSYVLPKHVQNLTLTGSADLTGTGNNLNNVITGNAGNDTLIGGSGNDTLIAGSGLATMIGGSGNNTFVVNNVNDVIVAQPTEEGNDGESGNGHGNTVLSSVNYVLPANVQNITLTGTADLSATGNNLHDVISANSGNDTLTAGTGLATLVGGSGNDTFVVNNAADMVLAQSTGSNINSVLSSVSYSLADSAQNAQNLILTGTQDITASGNDLNNVMTANNGNDTLIAGSGLATMIGGTGDDTFVVNNINDVVQAQSTGTNTNTVLSSVSYVAPANVQNITLTGTADLTSTGNDLNNVITANRGNDTLAGGSGIDVLIGGEGQDVLSDTSGKGILLGGTASDTLTGGAANDFIAGGRGDDVIATGSTSSVVAFNRGDGQDTITASTGAANTLSLGGEINTENLTLNKQGNDLILSTGSHDSITFQGWYASAANHDFATLQMVGPLNQGEDHHADNTFTNKINEFDFGKLVAQFDQARIDTPSLSNWQLMNGLLSAHLSGSDSAALGGDLAYYYGSQGTLSGMSLATAQSTLQSPQFGVAAQTVHPWASINQGATLNTGTGH